MPFLNSAIVVGLPVCGLVVAIDSYFYNQLTLMFYLNAVSQVNISHFFGTDPWWFYIAVEMPISFHVGFPILILGIISYSRDSWNKKTHPYLVYASLF